MRSPMPLLVRSAGILALVGLPACQPAAEPAAPTPGTASVAAGTSAAAFGPLTGAMFGNGRDRLVVFLHGDVSSGGPADYLYQDAAAVAAQYPGTTAAALLRPGYGDSKGQRSPGSNNNRRDHYTAENNRLVAETIARLKASTGAEEVIAVGHSGGAAQLGSILGQQPGLVDSAILVSCPCDVVAWRRSRGSEWPRSQSPIDFAGRVGPGTEVVLIGGQSDGNTGLHLARNYAAAVQAGGTTAEVVAVPGASHGYDGLRTAVNMALGELIAGGAGG